MGLRVHRLQLFQCGLASADALWDTREEHISVPAQFLPEATASEGMQLEYGDGHIIIGFLKSGKQNST